MREKYLLEKYLLLKILNRHPKVTRYWLCRQLSKDVFSIRLPTASMYDLISRLYKNKLLIYSEENKELLVIITDKGKEFLTEFEFKMRILLNTIV